MSMISLAAMPLGVEASSTEQSFKSVALLSCIGLVISIGLMTFGVDLGAAWI